MNITRISKTSAANAILLLLGLVTLFNLLVIAGMIPYSMVWGGRLTNPSQMIVFETVSIVVNLIVAFFVLLRVGYINTSNVKMTQIAMWVIVGLYVLGTIGNLFSLSTLERILFTPATLLLAFLTYRLALKE